MAAMMTNLDSWSYNIARFFFISKSDNRNMFANYIFKISQKPRGYTNHDQEPMDQELSGFSCVRWVFVIAVISCNGEKLACCSNIVRGRLFNLFLYTLNIVPIKLYTWFNVPSYLLDSFVGNYLCRGHVLIDIPLGDRRSGIWFRAS